MTNKEPMFSNKTWLTIIGMLLTVILATGGAIGSSQSYSDKGIEASDKRNEKARKILKEGLDKVDAKIEKVDERQRKHGELLVEIKTLLKQKL